MKPLCWVLVIAFTTSFFFSLVSSGGYGKKQKIYEPRCARTLGNAIDCDCAGETLKLQNELIRLANAKSKLEKEKEDLETQLKECNCERTNFYDKSICSANKISDLIKEKQILQAKLMACQQNIANVQDAIDKLREEYECKLEECQKKLSALLDDFGEEGEALKNCTSALNTTTEQLYACTNLTQQLRRNITLLAARLNITIINQFNCTIQLEQALQAATDCKVKINSLARALDECEANLRASRNATAQCEAESQAAMAQCRANISILTDICLKRFTFFGNDGFFVVDPITNKTYLIAIDKELNYYDAQHYCTTGGRGLACPEASELSFFSNFLSTLLDVDTNFIVGARKEPGGAGNLGSCQFFPATQALPYGTGQPTTTTKGYTMLSYTAATEKNGLPEYASRLCRKLSTKSPLLPETSN